MTIAIYPYTNGSKSAKALKEGLGCRLLKREGPRRKAAIIINWGSSNIERELVGEVINNPNCVRVASNKLMTFRRFADAVIPVPTVEWTTDIKGAAEWMNQGHNVVVRHKLTGHSGEGLEIIDIAEGPGGIIPAPLYTKYTKKTQEYRIHVFRGEVIFRQRKARKKDVPDDQVNWQVRNLAGGFIFANQDLEVPAAVEQAAIAAVNALGLDFGAADVGCNKEGQAVVYEVNTACGLEGENLASYVKKFREFE